MSRRMLWRLTGVGATLAWLYSVFNTVIEARNDRICSELMQQLTSGHLSPADYRDRWKELQRHKYGCSGPMMTRVASFQVQQMRTAA